MFLPETTTEVLRVQRDSSMSAPMQTPHFGPFFAENKLELLDLILLGFQKHDTRNTSWTPLEQTFKVS